LKNIILFFILLIYMFYIWSVFAIKKVNFSQSIMYQKKSVKIYWKTIKNISILIKVWKKEFKIKSNIKGRYSLKLHTLGVGKYKVISKVKNENNEYYLVPREKEIILSSKYIKSMKKYYIKKKYNKKYKKIEYNKSIILSVPLYKEIPVLPKLSKPKTTMNFFVLNVLLWIMSMLMLFLILKKNDLI